MEQNRRHLAAILFTDIVGYTAMMQTDEQVAVAVIKKHHQVMEAQVAAFHGEIHSFYGDGCLCIFSSATEAVNCAIAVQKEMRSAPIVPLRIGLHIGEVFSEEGKLLGDGVNISSRIQSLGQANTILFSKEIHDKLRNQPGFSSVSLGNFEFKNVQEPMEIFALANDGFQVPMRETMEGKLKVQVRTKGRLYAIWVVCIVLILVGSYLIYRQFAKPAFSSSKERSIAILPFTNMSSDRDNEYFSDGMTDEIITQISKISSFKVISRTSIMQYKNTNKSIRQIANELGVTTILAGAIQKFGDSVRINTQLIDAVTDQHIWAEIYDRSIKDLFKIQTEVAQSIAEALQTKLTPAERQNLSRHYTENVEAYKYYRKGRWFWDIRTKESYDSAELNFKKAIELDPDYALAYSGLADCYTFNQKGLSQLESIPIAREYVTKALLLDSNLCEGLTTLGFIQSAFDYDWKRSEITLKKAIALNPNYPIAHIYYGNLLQYTGKDPQDGLSEIRKALELDPLSSSVNWVLGRNLYMAGLTEAAHTQLKKTLMFNPQYAQARASMVVVLLSMKNYEEAFEMAKTLRPQWRGTGLSYAYAVSGDTMQARKILEKSLTEFPPEFLESQAFVYTALNERQRALDFLEKAFQKREVNMYWLKVDPELKSLRIEPRFKALLKKMNLD